MSKARLSRRQFVAASGTAVAASAMGLPSIIRAQERQLLIGGPGGQAAATKEHLIPIFEKQHNCTVHYDGSQSLPNLQKLQASRDNPIFDVVMMDDPILLIAHNEGLLAGLTPDEVPNMARLVPAAVQSDGAWLNYMWPAISIAYNTDAVHEVDSWTALWDPAYQERVLIPHPKTTQAPTVLAIAAHLETGKPILEAQYDMDAAFKKLKEMKPNILDTFTSSTKSAPLIEQGEAFLAGGFFATYTLPRKAKGAPIDLAAPKEGQFAMPKGIAKVKGAQTPELADAWIDACLGEEFQQIWMKEFYGVPTVQGAEVLPGLTPAEQLMALDWAYHSKILNETSERFDREIVM